MLQDFNAIGRRRTRWRKGSKDLQVATRVQPFGDESVRANENSFDAVTLGPAGEVSVVALQSQGSGADGFSVQADEARAEDVEDREIPFGHRGGGIDADAERQPLVA